MEKGMEVFLKYYDKYKEFINYIIFGGLTTLLNYISYIIFTRVLSTGVLTSTILAWFLAVLFAYITNKKIVFKSKASKLKQIAKEVIYFFSLRVVSGLFEVVFMYIFVTVISFNDMAMKLIANVIVIVLNYIFSKIVVFKNGSKNGNI